MLRVLSQWVRPTMKTDNCYNCGSTDSTFYAAENGYSLVKCSGCGLLYLAQRPDDAEISQAHRQGKHNGLTELDVTGAFDECKIQKYLKILDDIFEGNSGDERSWLDIGCGHGEFMAALQKYSSNKIHVIGSEPNIYKQESARKRGLNIDYFDLDSHADTYDVISLLNVYSHLPNPPDFLYALKKNLKRNGELIIETGDTADFEEKYHYRPFYLPDHLSFASERIILDILTRLGFQILNINKYPYPNLPELQIGPTRVAKEIIKAVLPNYKSRIPEYINMFNDSKRWAKTDMYIRARLMS